MHEETGHPAHLSPEWARRGVPRTPIMRGSSILSRAARTVLIAIVLSVVATLSVNDAQTQPSLTIVVLSGGVVNVPVTAADVETGRVEILDQTTLEVTADVNWQVNASVTIDSFPAGTENPTALALEVGNNDSPGVFVPGGGLVQTGVPGTTSFTVDFRINLSTLGDAPAGNYSFTITYTVSAL